MLYLKQGTERASNKILNTERASVSGGFAPDHHQGALPPGPQGIFAPSNNLPWHRPCMKGTRGKGTQFFIYLFFFKESSLIYSIILLVFSSYL